MKPTPFEKRTQEILEESTARLDGRTLSRLNRARHAALDRLQRPAGQWWRSYVPAGAAATVAVLAVLVVALWSARPDNAPLAQGASPVEDLELLADGDAPDFVDDADDLEFYEWAAGELES